MADDTKLFDALNQNYSGEYTLAEDGNTIIVSKETIVGILKTIKEKAGFKVLSDITSVDGDNVFEVVYHAMSLETAAVARLKVILPKDNPSIPSIVTVWNAANVLEREIYDMMGIIFEGHDNLKRILCPDDFEGHPLRKDFELNIIDRFN
jgi:NADH-quinone oxidoreductase subunit C